MFSINYGRYGLRKKQALWLVITFLLVAILIAGDLGSPDWSFHRWCLVSIALLWVFYLKQAALFREWIAHGGRKASIWSGLLVCLGCLIVYFGIAFAISVFEFDYLAYDLLVEEKYEKAEHVLLQSRRDHPNDLNVRYNLAVLYAQTHREPEAKQELRAIIEADPSKADAKDFLQELDDRQAVEDRSSSEP
ncbi:MAG: hypothetical protein A2X46_14560 [Lentisphaerae bacterium GWF2_57_35]|nr:MAG: hypothetical protein A2X46_14560 [Lentisphaerae bacterium GWF2_57_35]